MKRIILVLIILFLAGMCLAQGSPILPYITTFIRTLLDDADQSTARTTLGVGTGDTPQFAGASLNTSGTDQKLEINTGAATGGARLSYNDADGSAATYSEWTVDSTGDTVFRTKGDYFTFEGVEVSTSGTESFYMRLFSSTTITIGSLSGLNNIRWEMDFKLADDIYMTLGAGNDFGMAYNNSTDSLRILHPRFSTTSIWYFKGDDTLEFWSPTPYQTYRNTTHEDTDGGRESRINFVGEQSGGENSTLARIQGSHAGTGDNQEGDLIFYVNDGDDSDSPSEAMRLNSDGGLSTPHDPNTLGAGVTTFVIESNVMTITGDGGGNTIATITGADSGTLLTLIFVDGNVTITDTDAHTANTVDLAGAATNLTSADDTTLQIVYDGTSWYETSRSVN